MGRVQLSPSSVSNGKRQFLWKDVTGVELTNANAGFFAIRGLEPGKDRASAITQAFGHQGAALRVVVDDYRKQAHA